MSAVSPIRYVNDVDLRQLIDQLRADQWPSADRNVGIGGIVRKERAGAPCIFVGGVDGRGEIGAPFDKGGTRFANACRLDRVRVGGKKIFAEHRDAARRARAAAPWFAGAGRNPLLEEAARAVFADSA